MPSLAENLLPTRPPELRSAGAADYLAARRRGVIVVLGRDGARMAETGATR